MNGIHIRRATFEDLPAIVALLADDPLGAQREDASLPLAQSYIAAFRAIEADSNQLLAVVIEQDRVIGTLQLTFIPGIARKGAWRGQIEAVRVASDRRDRGLGRQIFAWAIAECEKRGCRLVQLTTDRSRTDAHRFYDQLGFEPSHIGYKRAL